MKTTLICTVGGSHEPIVHAIQSLQPGYVCFVCSEDDPATGQKGSYTQITGKGNIIKGHFRDEQPTLPNIPTQLGMEEDSYEVLKVSADDFDDIYRQTSRWFASRDPDERKVADYTGGTKTMSAALVAAALDQEDVELQLVSGSRANLVKVESGSEQPMPASVAATRFRRRFEKAADAWRRHAYEESVARLENITPPQDAGLRGEYQRALDQSRAYTLWDRFEHAQAHAILSRYRSVLGPQPDSRALLTALDKLVSDTPASEPMRLYDLWRNAQRRAAQQRYDDAMARAYRLLEWSAQWLLRENADIETADVPADKIPPNINLTTNREGKYQAGLSNAWALAAHYGDDALRTFYDEQKDRMLELVKARNYSILAHGFSPVGESQWQLMADWIERQLLPLLLQTSTRQPWRIHQLPPQLPTCLPELAS